MRFIEFKVLILAMVLLGSLFILPEIPEARADPTAYTAQKVGYYYIQNTVNDTMTADNAGGDASVYTTNYLSQSFLAFIGVISKIEIKVYRLGTPADLIIELREDNGAGSPSATSLANATGIPYTSIAVDPGTVINASFPTPYKVTTQRKLHFIYRTTGGSSSVYYRSRHKTSDGYRGTDYWMLKSVDSGASWTGTTTTDRYFKIFYIGSSSGYTASTDSDFWGSGTSKVYRFNFTGSGYLSPVTSTNRILNCTYPRNSYFLNISTSGGVALSSSEYSKSVFNGTHMMVVIPASTLTSKGFSYYFYSHEWSHVYWFSGLFYENGTYKNSVSLSMANSSGSWSYTLSHTLIVGTSSIPDAFYWPIGSYTRYIAPLEAHENFTITYPDGDVAGYSFMIRDFIGITAGQDCYLESSRTVNGSIQLIERILITTTINGVPLSLTQDRIYIIEIFDSSMDVGHEFGYFMPTGYNMEPSLTLQEMAFTDQAQMVSQYVRTEAQREDPYTSIIVIYNNTLSSEYNADANLLVKKRDGTLIYNSTTEDDAHTWTVPGLTNTTDYIIFLTVTHDFWGTLKWNKVLSGVHTFLSPPDLGVLGTWGGIPSGNILSAGLILLVAGLFSFLSAGLGIFVVVVLSAGLIRLGWVSSVSSGIILVCLGLAIMLALSQRLRR